MAKDLLSAHMNSINSTLAAVETQVASVKALMKVLMEMGEGKAPAETTDAPAPAEVEAPKTKRGRPAKAKQEPAPGVEDEPALEDDFSASDDDFSAGEDEIEDEKPAPKPGIDKTMVVKALQDYATKHDRKAAIKILTKFGVKSVHELDVKKYAEIIAALK